MSFITMVCYATLLLLVLLAFLWSWVALRKRVDKLEANVRSHARILFGLTNVLAGRGYARYSFDGTRSTIEYISTNKDACVVKFWSNDSSDEEQNNDNTAQ